MNRNINFLIWNFFLALLLWRGIEGNKTAQYIFAGVHWFGVSILIIYLFAISKVKEIKATKTTTSKTSLWFSIPVSIGFFSALIWFGWIWTAVAVALEFCFINELKELCEKKKLEVSAEKQ